MVRVTMTQGDGFDAAAESRWEALLAGVDVNRAAGKPAPLEATA